MRGALTGLNHARALLLLAGFALRAILVRVHVLPLLVAVLSGGAHAYTDRLVGSPSLYVGSSGSPALYVGNYGDDVDGMATIVVDSDGNVVQIFQDFDDIHKFDITFDYVRSVENDGAGAVDMLDVIWIGESPPAGQPQPAPYFIPQAAQALRMRNWQKTGSVGGTLRPDFAGENNSAMLFNQEFTTIDYAAADRFGLAYGLGVISTEQQIGVVASGSILGRNEFTAGIENQIVGPKAGVIWQGHRGKWSFDVQGLGLLGFNTGQVSQSATTGEELIPRTLNRPLYASRIESSEQTSRVVFAPAGELRAQTNLQVTKAMSLRTGWSTLIVSKFSDVTGAITGALPDIRFEVKDETLVLHQLFCGIEYVR